MMRQTNGGKKYIFSESGEKKNEEVSFNARLARFT